jgi:ABC-2 type transport system permease protein
MNRIFRIALRDFVAVVSTKGFIIGLLIMPAIMAVVITLGPRIFNDTDFLIEGELALVDPTGSVGPELRIALDPEVIAERRRVQFERGLEQAPEAIQGLAQMAVSQSMDDVLGPAPRVSLIDRPPDADVEVEKEWLNEESDLARHTALIVIHDNAVQPIPGETTLGTYDLYVAPGLDDRVLDFIFNSVREAIITARVSAEGLDRETIETINRVPRSISVTVSQGEDQETARGFSAMLPFAFMFLMFMGVMTGGQTMLTSTIEEKSSRVVEVLLSAVSPMELMAGKLLGGIAVSMVAMALYLLMGLAALSSFSLFGLLDPWLIVYLVIFFVIGFFVMGSLMMAVGASVNEMSEAQSLMMPIMLMMMVPMLLWLPISRSPNSVLALVASFVPPVNSFGMLIRMSSSQPPPLWQVWLSIGIGAVSVVGTLWIAAKIFKIGLLMYGKPPNIKTLIRWVRAA